MFEQTETMNDRNRSDYRLVSLKNATGTNHEGSITRHPFALYYISIGERINTEIRKVTGGYF